MRGWIGGVGVGATRIGALRRHPADPGAYPWDGEGRASGDEHGRHRSVLPARVAGVALLHVLEQQDHPVDEPELAAVDDDDAGDGEPDVEGDQPVDQHRQADAGEGVGETRHPRCELIRDLDGAAIAPDPLAEDPLRRPVPGRGGHAEDTGVDPGPHDRERDWDEAVPTDPFPAPHRDARGGTRN